MRVITRPDGVNVTDSSDDLTMINVTAPIGIICAGMLFGPVGAIAFGLFAAAGKSAARANIHDGY
jgi:LytS/YehU family sensor histidine kinase